MRPTTGTSSSAVLGLVGAVAVLVALAGLLLLSVRPFASGDESAHADYAVTLVQDHRLPTQFETVQPRFEHQSEKPQHVANHPPLYYLLIGPPLVAGLDGGHPLAGYLGARTVSLLAAVASVLLVAGVARALVGPRRVVVVGAAALVASYRPFVEVAAVLHNDTTSLAFGAAATWLVVLVVRRGPDPRRVALLALVTLLGCGVRAENAAVTALAAAAVLVASVLHAAPEQRWRSGLRRGLVGGFAVGLASLLAVGWFYWRSTRLYGNPLGYGVIEPQFGRAELPTSSFWLFRRPDLVLTQLGLPPTDALTTPTAALVVVPFVAVVAGLGLLVVSAVRSRDWVRSAPAVTTGPSARATWVALAVLVSLHAAVVLAMVVRHVDAGGGARVRYLFPLLPFVATGAALALARLPGGARGRWIVVAVVAGAVNCLDGTGTAAWRWWQAEWRNGPVLEGVERGLRLMGVPAPGVVLAGVLALLVVGVVLVAVSARTRQQVVDEQGPDDDARSQVGPAHAQAASPVHQPAARIRSAAVGDV